MVLSTRPYGTRLGTVRSPAMLDDPRSIADAVPERRSDRKRRVILEAATARFLRSGYAGTSMDEIAADAAVSKQTVYKHFDDKERLFREIVAVTVDEISDPNYEAVIALQESGDIGADLRELARGQLRRVMQ